MVTCIIRGSVGMSQAQFQLAPLMQGVALSLNQHEALLGSVAEPLAPKRPPDNTESGACQLC